MKSKSKSRNINIIRALRLKIPKLSLIKQVLTERKKKLEQEFNPINLQIKNFMIENELLEEDDERKGSKRAIGDSSGDEYDQPNENDNFSGESSDSSLDGAPQEREDDQPEEEVVIVRNNNYHYSYFNREEKDYEPQHVPYILYSPPKADLMQLFRKVSHQNNYYLKPTEQIDQDMFAI